MVRLRHESFVQNRCFFAKVSIPLWCDYDLVTLVLLGVVVFRFNPTMVRLRQFGLKRFRGCHRMFQSHYGAIATPPPSLSALEENSVSIPLWCDCDSNAKEPSLAFFNPTMVRLRLEVKDGVAVLHLGRFNPTMVRLRPEIALEYALSRFVSIPLWCDCDRSDSGASTRAAPVSIPLWCDCDLAPGSLAPIISPSSFQSHYGAIATLVFISAAIVLLVMFQSHYGAIATKEILSC